MDDFKNEYINSINGKQYDKLIEILIKNLIHNINYKSVCDLGTYMCDSDSSGITVTLSEKQCKEFGKSFSMGNSLIEAIMSEFFGQVFNLSSKDSATYYAYNWCLL